MTQTPSAVGPLGYGPPVDTSYTGPPGPPLESIAPIPHPDASKSYFTLVNTYDQGTGKGLQPQGDQIGNIASINRTWVKSDNKDDPGTVYDEVRGGFLPYREVVYGVEYVDHEGNTKESQYTNTYHGDTQVGGVTEVHPEGSISLTDKSPIDYNKPYDSSTATTPVGDAAPTDSTAPTQTQAPTPIPDPVASPVGDIMPGGYDVPSADYSPIPGGYDGFQFGDPNATSGIDESYLPPGDDNIMIIPGGGEDAPTLTPFPPPHRRGVGSLGISQTPHSLNRNIRNKSLKTTDSSYGNSMGDYNNNLKVTRTKEWNRTDKRFIRTLTA